jgi:cytochrome c oxidase subunit 1
MLRRMSDGGINYSMAQVGLPGALSPTIMELNRVILWGAVGLGLSQIPFIINLFWSIKHGQKITSDNPWDATTLEWQTETPPYVYNFRTEPVVHRGPYEYSVPGADKDFLPQTEPDRATPKPSKH